jgi:NAD(P)-dependent dehydrogenase (short-subunit alcohol dehydrogenase family)
VSSICRGRVAIVTGAGRGIGRGHALSLASEGAQVVVNDLGSAVDGTGADRGPAQVVVDEIRSAGGTAIENGDDVSTWAGAQAVVASAIETFGSLDVVVNNAGILRDRMLVNMTEGEWDDVIRVHLKGTVGPTHFAAAYWRERSKSDEADERAPDNIAPLVTWLASPESAGVTGQVFLVSGGRIAIATGWGRGSGVDRGAKWEPIEVAAVVHKLIEEAES